MKTSIILLLIILDINSMPIKIFKKINKKYNQKLKLPKTQGKNYNPKLVDWKGVISGCKAACDFDKRLCNWYIRAAAHDSLSIAEEFGGADGSLVLSDDELRRPENNYDSFAFRISKNVLFLANKYNSSVADTIAVCGAVSSNYLGTIDIIKESSTPFYVGRIDDTEPNPSKSLAPENMNLTSFKTFATNRGLTVEDMTALMASHALIDSKGCFKPKNYNELCNPNTSKCDDIAMFTFDNSYYLDLCSSNLTFHEPKLNIIEEVDLNSVYQNEQCKFTSSYFRETIDIKELISEEPEVISKTFTWNLTQNFIYTTHDGFMGLACQNKIYDPEIQNIMRSFFDFQKWNLAYSKAYKKMINIGAKWSRKMVINGEECPNSCTFYTQIKKQKCNCQSVINNPTYF